MRATKLTYAELFMLKVKGRRVVEGLLTPPHN